MEVMLIEHHLNEFNKHIKHHLDKFNKIILALKNSNIKIDDEDQVLILLCSLSFLYEHFVDTMLDSWNTYFMKNTKLERVKENDV